MEDETLLDKFYGIIDGYYSGTEDFKDIEKVLIFMDKANALRDTNISIRSAMEEIENELGRIQDVR